MRRTWLSVTDIQADLINMNQGRTTASDPPIQEEASEALDEADVAPLRQDLPSDGVGAAMQSLLRCSISHQGKDLAVYLFRNRRCSVIPACMCLQLEN